MSASEIANIYSSINNIQLGLNEVTGNTFSNYNQLSRIVAQQANIYNSVYYGSGNILTGNIVVNNNANINGGIIQNYNQAILCNNGTYNFELAAGATGAYIDFHTSSNITNDYDSRIIATGGGLMGSGNITLDARNVSITGNLSVNTNSLTYYPGWLPFTTTTTITIASYKHDYVFEFKGGTGQTLNFPSPAAGMNGLRYTVWNNTVNTLSIASVTGQFITLTGTGTTASANPYSLLGQRSISFTCDAFNWIALGGRY